VLTPRPSWDPCAICLGEYKGNFDVLKKEVDDYYLKKKQVHGAPASTAMER